MEKSWAVFCGSRHGNNPIYTTHAIELGKLMAKNGITLIYGGGKVGLMGAVADAVIEAGGQAIGVMPDVLIKKEQQHDGLSELIVVRDMHTRKKIMYEKCSSTVILPGGIGTMDELFETYTWNSLQIHEKRICLLNSNGFYNPLIAHLDNMQTGGFLHGIWTEKVSVFNTPQEIVNVWNVSTN